MAISNARIVGYHVDGGASEVHLLHPDAAGSTDGTTIQDTALTNAMSLLSTTLGGRIKGPPGATLVVDNVALTVPHLKLDMEHVTLSKSTNTVGHMFYCLDGSADDFEMIGGDIQMNATSFSSGQTVSAFHMVRTYGLRWRGTKFSSGIEEGLKLYNCKDLHLTDVEFDDFANNGVQVAVQSSSADGFTGSSTRSPEDFDGIWLTNVRLKNMDDGSVGEGQGVSWGVASGSKTIRNVFIDGYYAENCYRSLHSEVNLSSQQIENFNAVNVTLKDPIRAGISLAGVENGNLANIVVTQTSSAAAASTEGESNLITITGSSDTPSRNINLGHVVLAGASSSNTDYGILVKQTCGFTWNGQGHISGVATKLGSDSWNTVWDFAAHDKNPIAYVAPTSAQATTSGTWTSVLWGEDIRDPHGMNSSSTSASHKITPPWPGVFRVNVADVWPGSTGGGDRGLRIYRDDGVTATVYAEVLLAAASSDTGVQAAAVIPLQQGASQFVRVERFQNSGGDLTPSTASKHFAYLTWEAGTT